MKVEIKLFASLGRYGTHLQVSDDGKTDIPSSSTPGKIADMLNIPRPEIKLIFINGVRGTLDSVIHDGDRVGFFPPIGGG